MALKTSVRRRMREQEIRCLFSTVPDPRLPFCVREGRILSAEDVAEEVRRGTPLGETTIRTLLP